MPWTWWPHQEVGHSDEAKKEIYELLGKGSPFDTPKPTRLLYRIIFVATKRNDIVFDFFAGSGTSGHAIVSLNREDGEQRRFVMVEMADFFDSILLPRMKRVIYAPEWKDGKPSRLPNKEEVARTPRLVKVLRLESYEDALHNLVTEDTLAREAPRAKAHKKVLGEEAYRLRYLACLPLESSASLLALDKLEHPFEYKLEVLTEEGPKTQNVELVETFNLLYGLHVQRREIWENDADHRSHVAVKSKDRESRRVLVLWRDMGGLDPEVERRFLEDRIRQHGPFDEILINGDSAVPGVRSPDGLFKRLMEEGQR